MRKSLRPKWRDFCALFASLLGSGSSLPSGAARYCVLPWNAKSVGALNRLDLYHAQDRSLFLTDFLRPRFVRGRERAISDGRYPRHGRAYDSDSKLSPHDRDEQANPQRLPTVSAGRQPSTKSSADLSISLSTSAALQIAAALSFSWLPRRSFSWTLRRCRLGPEGAHRRSSPCSPGNRPVDRRSSERLRGVCRDTACRRSEGIAWQPPRLVRRAPL